MNTKHRILTLLVCLLMGTLLIFGMASCDGGTEPETTDSTATDAPGTPTEEPEVPTEAPEVPTEAPTEEVTTEEETMSVKDQLGLDIKLSDLEELMQPIFSGNTSKNETVMFLDKGDVKELLFPIETVISVTSYDGSIVYEEGKDYVVTDGKLQVTEGSAIPCITSERFYNYPGSLITVKHEGKVVPLYWGEGRIMTDWQVNVNYTHSAAWEGYVQENRLETYRDFVAKLVKGEDVTVFFYGDSITWGASASSLSGCAPYQATYPIMFTKALADLFDYKVHFVDAKLTASMATAPVPAEDYVAGERGTITYINTAIGGWTSADGWTNYEKFIKEKVEEVGCDLFVIGYGMNDGGFGPRQTVANVVKVVDGVLSLEPESAIAIVATMVPNPDGIGWYNNQPNQEGQFIKQADKYREDGVDCGVCCMTSVSLAILEHKDFHDYSGNNINHPNDYFVRVYAQTLLQTIIGYDNMN